VTNDDATELSLHREPSEVARGRRHVAAACKGYSQDLVATATLLASELISNALDHGSGDIVVAVTRAPGRVRVDVRDRSAGMPQRGSRSADDERGRGMLILESLASAWGVEPLRGGGKSVWFVLRAGI